MLYGLLRAFVVAHDDSAVEFTVFGQFLALVADIVWVIAFVLFLWVFQWVPDTLETCEHPEVVVFWKTYQANHVIPLVQVLRIFPVVVPHSGQKPIGVELIGVSLEHLDGFGAIVVGHETDFRPADLLVSEVEQVI